MRKESLTVQGGKAWGMAPEQGKRSGWESRLKLGKRVRLGKGPGCGKGPVLEKVHRLDRVAQAEDGRLAGLGEIGG